MTGEQAHNALGEAPRITRARQYTEETPHVKFLTPEGRQLLIRLSIGDPSAILKEYIENDNASTESIRLCLEEQYSRIAKYPRKIRLEMMQKGKIGGLTLQWLWENNLRWSTMMQEDMVLFESLVYFLCAEDLDKFVLGWIRSDLPSGVVIDSQGQMKNQDWWRGGLLRRIVNARLMLEYRPRADTALNLYLDFERELTLLRDANRRAGRKDKGFARTSLWPAKVLLANALATGRYPETNAESYQRLLRQMETEKKKGDTALSVAQLYIEHPAAPDAGPMWSLLQRYLGDKTQVEALEQFMASGPRARVNLLFAMKRAARLLRMQGRTSDAHWVLKTQSELLAGADEGTRKLYQFHETSPEGTWQHRREEKERAAPGGLNMPSVPKIRKFRV
ncbi:hypothetical protein LTR15_012431 [Elasticomyces elasticus]|nr:hypothetical protein LTR15_012431 [Elasticomyces elasticus]